MSCVAVVVVSLLLVWTRVPLHTAAARLRCNEQGYLGQSSISVYCDTVTTDSLVTWTLVTEAGDTVDLGSCDGLGSCQSLLSSSATLYRTSVDSNRVTLQGIARETVGTLICSEAYGGRSSTDSCTIRLVSTQITCPTEGREIEERSSSNSVYCSVTNSSRPVTWSLLAQDGKRTELGTCFSQNNCTSSPDQVFNATRPYASRSDLIIKSPTRGSAGTLLCSDGQVTSRCPLTIYKSASHLDCSVYVERANWTAVGKCSVSGIFSSLGNFGFRILQIWRNGQTGERADHYLDGGQRVPFTATPYTDLSGQQFYRGSFTYSWPLPTRDGYYYYRAHAYPGSKSATIYEGFLIERPVRPAANCSTPSQGGSMSCVCTTPSLGMPAGRLRWLSGDTVLAEGQYGHTELRLPSGVQVGDRGQSLFCQLDWLVKTSVPVAFPLSGQPGAGSDQQTGQKDNCGDYNLMLGAAVGGYVLLAVVLIILLLVVILALKQRNAGRSTPSQAPKPDTSRTEEEQHTYSQLHGTYENPSFAGGV